MGKRVLFLGVTGIDKKQALTKLATKCLEYGHTTKVLDFEGDFLCHQINMSSFLDTPLPLQRGEWDKAWNEALEAVDSATENNIFLGMHGCYVRGHYGTRWVLDIQKVATFKPDVIITLLADVYDCWQRTEARAEASGAPWRGKPTLEQLILARRNEVAVGDHIRLSCENIPDHFVLAGSHPVTVFMRIVMHENPKIIYLSFPISGPRDRFKEQGDTSGIAMVSEYIRKVYERQQLAMDRAIVCPLSIDEYPFVKANVDENYVHRTVRNEAGEEEQQPWAFNFNPQQDRWNLADMWPVEDRLVPAADMERPFPLDQIKRAEGNIKTDIGWRDYRLAEQADCIAVFSPIFYSADRRAKGKPAVARGVNLEMAHGLKYGKHIWAYQNPDVDPEGAFLDIKSRLGVSDDGDTGTMPDGPGTRYNAVAATEEEFLDLIQKGDIHKEYK